ncbi:hypothetical protein DPMN_179601 [Dreissena polymorpha]|uniref:Uncharacterized protein n=1 Tax=Dreissena polymorpha TaxID=45954 RepID=A0A9D4EEC1_DREPO|nr:hypothetical protein DPMN_179601 [Dreissena polymorpha]
MGMCSMRLPVRLSICRVVRFSRPSIFTMQLNERSSSFNFSSLSSFSIFSMMLLLSISTCRRFNRSRFSMY